MSVQPSDFQGEIILATLKFHAYANVASELTAIQTALGSDTSTHDTTITWPPAGLQYGPVANTDFTEAVLYCVNKGKAGNLATAAMATAIGAVLGGISPPVNTAAPVASGTGTVGQVLTTTNGAWTNAPASYAYAWYRGAAAIAGATASTYTLVAADSGTNVSCRVTAINAAGPSAPVASNAIAVA